MTTLAATGHLLLLAVCFLAFAPVRRLSPLPRGVALVVCLMVGLARVGDLRLIAYPAGILGDLSVTTQLLLLAFVSKRVAGIESLPAGDRSFLLGAAASVGLILYIFSSGLTAIDVYALGFGSPWLMGALAAAILTCGRYRPGAGAVLLLGVVAFDFGLLASSNIWDYLLDPLLVLFAWGWTLTLLPRRFRSPAASYGKS